VCFPRSGLARLPQAVAVSLTTHPPRQTIRLALHILAACHLHLHPLCSYLYRQTLHIVAQSRNSSGCSRAAHARFGLSKVSCRPKFIASSFATLNHRASLPSLTNRRRLPSSPSPWRTCRSCLLASTAATTSSNNSTAIASPLFRPLYSHRHPAALSLITSLLSCRQTRLPRRRLLPNTAAPRRHSNSPRSC